MVKTILRLEGLAIFVATLYIYNFVGAGWLFFVLMLLIPDISMLGYLRNKKVGSMVYNLVHNYAFAFLVVFLGILVGNIYLLSYGLVVIAHIGMDHFLGFGLKYPTAFKDSHIQRV